MNITSLAHQGCRLRTSGVPSSTCIASGGCCNSISSELPSVAASSFCVAGTGELCCAARTTRNVASLPSPSPIHPTTTAHNDLETPIGCQFHDCGSEAPLASNVTGSSSRRTGGRARITTGSVLASVVLLYLCVLYFEGC